MSAQFLPSERLEYYNSNSFIIFLGSLVDTPLLFVLFEFVVPFTHFIPGCPRGNDCPLGNVIVQLIIFCLKTLQFLEISTIWIDITFFCTFLQLIFHLLQFRSSFTGFTLTVCDCSLSYFVFN